MNKKMLVRGSLALSVLGAVILVVALGSGPTGQATGSKVRKSDKKTVKQEVWTELASYDNSYLSAYADYFQEGDTDPLELLSAFNELAFQVTGAGGIWRDTVPNKYFGCQMNEDFEICIEFKNAEASLAKWDAFQAQAAEVDNHYMAGKFIVIHGAEIREYLETFVPENESLSAVQATPFFRRFAPSLGM